MDDRPETTQQNSAAQRALDNRIEAYALLGNFRPAQGSAEAIAAAQVHATLALVDVQIDIARLLSSAARELNASNMFKQTETLNKDHPLRQVIHDGLLKHLTEQGGLHTDVTLGLRCQQLKIDIKPGDDIVLTDALGEQSITLLVIDAEQDQWLFLRETDGDPDNIEVDSPKIHAIFDAGISTLAVAKVFP